MNLIMIKWYDLYKICHRINKLLYPNCWFEFLKFQALNESGKRVGAGQALLKSKISSHKLAGRASRSDRVLNEPGCSGSERVELTSPRQVMLGESGMYH
jgi:hypothetical protein